MSGRKARSRRFAIPASMFALAILVGTAPAVLSQSSIATGQVTRIDEAAGKITLRHGPIRNLDMDAMTMVFRVKDPAILKSVKVGDNVRFEAERLDGAITITRMERSR